ncbi:hypothetical protein AAV95_24980, partial [Mycolicibacterium elephantis]
MTEPQHAVIARLSADFAAISQYMARVSTDLTELDRLLSGETAGPAVPVASYWPQSAQPQYAQPQYAQPHYAQPQHAQPQDVQPKYAQPQQVQAGAPTRPRKPRDEGWIGKVLAVAGVAVTLIGVVLLLVLAAQAGILRPEIRVAALS